MMSPAGPAAAADPWQAAAAASPSQMMMMRSAGPGLMTSNYQQSGAV